MRLIDATELETKLLNMINLHSEIENPMAIILLQCATDIIRKMPVIKAEPVRHGKWCETHNIFQPLYCDACHRCAIDITPYCPHCGAKMDGGERSD